MPDRPEHAKRDRWMWAALAMLAVGKLVLVSHHEVAVRGYDDGNFAFAAVARYWSASYGPFTHVRQPVYPLFIAAGSMLGLPLRLSIELVWLASCGVMAAGLRAARVSGWLAAAGAAVVMVHPWSIAWLDRMVQDTLYAPLVVMFVTGLAGAAAAGTRRSMWRWGALAAAAGALAAGTRPEAVLLYGSLAVGAAIVAARWRWGGLRGRAFRERGLAAVGLPLAAMLALTLAICWKNQAKIGLFAMADLKSPGMAAMYDALLAIEPPPEGAGRDPRLPIVRAVREQAYAASPTFATLRPWLDGKQRQRGLMQVNFRHTGVRGEYGGWMIWALRSAAWSSRGEQGWASARELDGFYFRIAGELRAGAREGRLKTRAVPVSFVPPEWGAIARAWPRSMIEAWRVVARAGYEREFSDANAMNLAPVFNAAAVRRRAGAAVTDQQTEVLKDSVWFSPRVIGALDGVKRSIAAAERPITGACPWVGLVGLGAGLWRIRRDAAQRRACVGCGALAALVWTALLARLALLALMDTLGLPLLERYLLPAVPLAVMAGVLGVHGLVVALGGRGRTGGLQTGGLGEEAGGTGAL